MSAGLIPTRGFGACIGSCDKDAHEHEDTDHREEPLRLRRLNLLNKLCHGQGIT
jgi:hypothetical protein